MVVIMKVNLLTEKLMEGDYDIGLIAVTLMKVNLKKESCVVKVLWNMEMGMYTKDLG